MKLNSVKCNTSLSWNDEEENIFKLCCLKYGCGDYNSIIKGRHLVSKNRQQLYNKLKKLLGLKTVKAFNKIHVNFDNFKLSEEEIYKFNEHMSFEEQVNFAQCFNDEVNYENIEIPYYRRWLAFTKSFY